MSIAKIIVNNPEENEKYKITIIGAAIRFYDSENDVWLQVNGRRHHEIIKKIAEEGYSEDYKANHIDGFIYFLDEDTFPMFMDRETATEIAQKAGIKMIGSVLTSEDLW